MKKTLIITLLTALVFIPAVVLASQAVEAARGGPLVGSSPALQSFDSVDQEQGGATLVKYGGRGGHRGLREGDRFKGRQGHDGFSRYRYRGGHKYRSHDGFRGYFGFGYYPYRPYRPLYCYGYSPFRTCYYLR